MLKPDAVATEAELIAHASTKIAGFKVPKSVDFVDVCRPMPRASTEANAPCAVLGRQGTAVSTERHCFTVSAESAASELPNSQPIRATLRPAFGEPTPRR